MGEVGRVDVLAGGTNLAVLESGGGVGCRLGLGEGGGVARRLGCGECDGVGCLGLGEANAARCSDVGEAGGVDDRPVPPAVLDLFIRRLPLLPKLDPDLSPRTLR